MQIVFSVPGTPKLKQRPRVTRYGAYTPKETKEYEAYVRDCYRLQTDGAVIPEGSPIKVSITAFFPIPKSKSKKKQRQLDTSAHLSRPDLDNVVKAVTDALNGVAFADDSAIYEISATKLYSYDPRTVIILEGDCNEA